MKTAAAIAIIATLLLGACGGGGDAGSAPVVVADSTETKVSTPGVNSTSTGMGFDFVGGPRYTLSGPANVEICVTATWQHTMAANAGLRLRGIVPAPTNTNRTVEQAGTGTAGQPATVTFTRCDVWSQAAGARSVPPVRLDLFSECGGCAALGSQYAVTVRWQVSATY